MGDPTNGATLYTQYTCNTCHGDTGKSDGVAVTEAMDPKPTELASTELDDAGLKAIIKGGGQAVERSPTMPPLGAGLTDQQLDDVVAYIRTFAAK